MLLLACSDWSLYAPHPPTPQRVQHAAASVRPSPVAAAQVRSDGGSNSLFDHAMQQLACRERQREHAAQIARGAAMQPGGTGCVAGTPLQIDAMVRTAAARGDAEARRYLLAQRAAELMQRAVAMAPAGTPATLSADDEREVAAIVRQLETLALAGQRDAIETLAQVVEAPLLQAPDPVYAAAWRLAARQPPGRTLDAAAPLQAEDELLESMTQLQQQQARALAVELFGYCCRTRAEAGQ
ncbi:hypothetical protein ACCQ05_00905 [Xanthomonas sp. NCPPB 3582]|uniref:hypothetical protein n=1 Tax=Xanthomonas sp. NCPPB 3582 TaxID=487557 RepID=UPI003557F495